MKLHRRIYLHSLLVLLVVVASIGLVFALRGPGMVARDVGERVTRHVERLVREQLADPGGLQRRLDTLHADLGVDIAVMTPDGTVRAAAGAALLRPAAAALARARAGEPTISGHPSHSVVTPIRDGAGAVVAVAAMELRGRFGPPNFFGPLALVAVVLVTIAVVTRPLARRIARPIEVLTATARRLAAGDLSARARGGAGAPHRRHGADEIRELTHAFDEMADRVQHLVRGQRELLANVSHELRSPLARIRVALELVPRTPDVDARLADIDRDLGELERLIEDVLATARLDATGLPTELATVDAAALLAELVERARHDPATTGREVRVDGSAGVHVSGDPRLLRRALWNLVENAAKYGAPPIVLGAAVDGDRVTLSVSDAGPGIPRGARARVLDPFERLDTARTPGRSTSGFGLGLAFARRVAEAHGGAVTISAATPDERGCRVSLRLPLAPP
jgi:signal transduction histidine kinase